MRFLLRIIFFVSAIMNSVIVDAATPVNLVQNPGFESGASPWLFTGSSGLDTHDPGSARSGHNQGYINSFSPASGTISQDIATVAGETYRVDAWIAQNGSASGHVTASFDGHLFADFAVDSHLPVGPSYQEFFGSFTASSSSTPLVFKVTTVNQTIFFDDISVLAVPEPDSFSLLMLGLCVVGIAGRSLGRRLAPAYRCS